MSHYKIMSFNHQIHGGALLASFQDGRIAWRNDDEVKKEGTTKAWKMKSQKALTDKNAALACSKFLAETVARKRN